ncbi:GroES-like protein [Hymenopellis radicata]|nr:GroES-like protein [Hymenopellis radicata]
MSSPQQNALIVPSLRAPFELAQRAVPSPGPGDVLIKIMAVALNPMDWLKAEHDFLIDEYPQVLGHDIAGVIEQLGEGIEGFKKGDRVFTQSLNGGFQQYTVLPAAALMHIPTSLSFDAAATFPITFPTACVGLFAPAPIGAGLNPTFSWDKPHQGESALVLGGSTSTGQFAIQLFKFLGYTQILVYASKKHFDFLRQLGATVCIDRAVVSTDALPTSEAITSVSPPLKVVYDAVGNLNTAYDCVADGGQAITVLPMAPLNREGKTVEVTRVQGYYVGPDHTTFGKLIMKNLPEMIEKGVVTPNRLEVLSGGLSGILTGLERLKHGEVSGVKLVAHPQDN